MDDDDGGDLRECLEVFVADMAETVMTQIQICQSSQMSEVSRNCRVCTLPDEKRNEISISPAQCWLTTQKRERERE